MFLLGLYETQILFSKQCQYFFSEILIVFHVQPSKEILFWLPKQIKTPYQYFLELFCEIAVPKESRNIPRKMSMVESRFINYQRVVVGMGSGIPESKNQVTDHDVIKPS